MKSFLFVLFGYCFLASFSDECSKRNYSGSSFICVCNSTFCNFDGDLLPFEENEVRVVKTSQDQFRNYQEVLLRQDGQVNASDVDTTITINSTIRMQTILGFGGALTDSSAINIKDLSEESQDNLIKMYFGPQGSRYNIIRVNIGGCDASLHPYSLDDVEGDVDLVHFNLTEEDYSYKIPVLKQAITLSSDEIYIFGSPWSPPTWMKTNGKIGGQGQLLKEMWQPFANYLVKFFQMYENNLGVKLWGLTPENEPLVSINFTDNFPQPNCLWWPEDMRDWISTILGPTLVETGYNRLNLMIYDYDRRSLVEFVEPILSDLNASQYVHGTAIHWYVDDEIGPEVLDTVHYMDPSKFILYTEACTGIPFGVVLGSWKRGEKYITDIIQDSNHWSSGWVDWNIAVDLKGGPNWVHLYVDSPIIVNATADEFYVQPLYYALNLFSRNVPRGSVHIYTETDNTNITATAFVNPDEEIVLIVANISDDEHTLGVRNENGVYVFKYTIEARTWLALTYKNT